jgi:HK97 family phage prohead protease
VSERRNPIEFRTAVEVTDVRYPERIVDVLAVPYETPTDVEYRGRIVSETIARGAFAAAAAHPRKRPVYREHNYDRQCGIIRHLVDGRDALRAELKIMRGPAGDETLDMCDDGMLDASIGFAPKVGCEKWTPDRRARTITDAYLEHIALVAIPAYADARVLAVRHRRPEPAATVPTPNLDQIHAAELAARYDRLR